jgi:hypothetical protein
MKYKIQGLILGIILLIPLSTFGQDELPSGKFLGRIFADFKQQLNGEDSFSGFSVRRANLGYNYTYDTKISAQILIDIGSFAVDETRYIRYALLKNALIQYKATDKLTLSGGITEVKGSVVQNSYWGRKYIRHPFLLQYGFMNSADLGFTVDYKVSDIFSFDVGVFNGEGYHNIQDDNILQYATGITLTPISGLSIRLNGDLYIGEDASRNTVAGFVGYKNSKFMIGAEYSYRTDIDMTDMHNIYGYNIIASVNIAPKLDLFGRFDKLGSVTLEGDTDPWNISKDGSLIIGGLQYTYAKYIKFALNYQGWTPDDSNEKRWDYIQVNALFKF